MVRIMSIYDTLSDYLKEVQKERMAKIDIEVEEYKQKHPHATTEQIENLEQNLYWKAQRESAIEIDVLAAGKFWPKQEKEPFIIDLLKAPIPLWCVVFIFTLVLIALI